MDIAEFARAVFALAVTLGLVGLAAVGMRRFAPEWMARLQTRRGTKRRLSVVETLVLDPHRRLVLVRCDDQERLVLLGEGQVLLSATSAQSSVESPSSTPADETPPLETAA